VIGAIALVIVVSGAVGALAVTKINGLEDQRNGLRREKATLLSVKAHDEAALQATRTTLAETSAQVATMKAKVAHAQAAASSQFDKGYSAGANGSYNSGYDSGYTDGYNQGFLDGYGG
jgi:flagellar biosynthesis/type III secretory pathway protein FliH